MALTGNRLSLNRLPADATHKRKAGRSGAWNGPLCVAKEAALPGNAGGTGSRLGFCQVYGSNATKAKEPGRIQKKWPHLTHHRRPPDAQQAAGCEKGSQGATAFAALLPRIRLSPLAPFNSSTP